MDSDNSKHCFWVKLACLRCGKEGERKYCLATLDHFDHMCGYACSCGNKAKELFKLLKMEVQKAIRL